jgi:glycosyltransferase involved in cell wall biosynthesis
MTLESSLGEHVPDVSIVVPVYNGSANLPTLVQELVAVFDREHLEAEILCVNDGSRDRSWITIQELAALEPRVRGFDLTRNFGQHNALLCGIRAARGSVIVTLDDDLQHPPEEIPRLLAALTPEIDVVYGTPRDEQHGFARRFASHATKIVLQEAMGATIAGQVSAFRAFRTSLRDSFAGYSNWYVSIDVLLSWVTTRFAAIEVRHAPRRSGTSGYALRQLVRHGFNMVTGFSAAPLRLASLVGFASTVLGLVVLVYVVGRYLLFGTTVPGFPFLASVIAILGGAQMFTLGIMGEYLARIHSHTLSRPIYAVRTSTLERRAR